MFKGITWLFSTIGTYEVLRVIWTYFEKLETGKATQTTVDTVICLIISAIVSLALLEQALLN